MTGELTWAKKVEIHENALSNAHGKIFEARTEVQVEQLVDDPVALLQQHVLAGDPEVGGAGLDVGGHVGGAHRHQLDPVQLEGERPRL